MSKRLCRKCGGEIPTRKIIDGKVRNFQNRKFCLICSPFGSRNTKSDDPSRPSKTLSNYKNWTDDQKLLHGARVYKKGIERKIKLIEMAGGKCKQCGYDKCMRALSFHHRDRKTKKFSLRLNELWSKSWETIVDEFNKCELLCVRCHIEEEDKFSKINQNNYKEVIEKLSKKYWPKKEKKKRLCEQCGKEISKSAKRCEKCYKHKRRKIKNRPNKEIILKQINELGYCGTGRLYGVSDNAIRKWIKQF